MSDGETHRVLILGNGARERIIAEKLLASPHVASVQHMTTLTVPDYTPLVPSENQLLRYCGEHGITCVVPSSEDYLANGVVDVLGALAPECLVFGPSREQSKLESSKHYSKTVMRELGIPTADYVYFTDETALDRHLANMAGDAAVRDAAVQDVVLKYSGLAKGKGVCLPSSHAEARTSAHELFRSGSGSGSGSEGVLMEQRLAGTEVSVLAFCDGQRAHLMPAAQDYKRLGDGNTGPNTGGMGAVCPVDVLTPAELAQVKEWMDRLVRHTGYRGVLYSGLMKTATGVYFLELNCRFGDPEAQVILSLLESDLFLVMKSCMAAAAAENGGSPGLLESLVWCSECAAAVVLSHKWYPARKIQPAAAVPVTLGATDSTVQIYEANVTRTDDGRCVTTGGRVLSVVSRASSIPAALENIYNNTHKIRYPGVYYRRDIGSGLPPGVGGVGGVGGLGIGVLASGNGTCLEKLVADPGYAATVKIIITDRKDAGVVEKARRLKIPFVYLPTRDHTGAIEDTRYYERVVNILRLFDVELVLLAGFMRIVSPCLFDEFFTVNIHPSLLPAYAHMMDLAVHEAVIADQASHSGCTLHRVTADVDQGRILLQKQTSIEDLYTTHRHNHFQTMATALKARVQNEEQDCVLEFVQSYARRRGGQQPYTVDIAEGNALVNTIKAKLPEIGGFCAVYQHRGVRLAAAADGCGTKIDLAVAYDRLDTIGIDLVAMNVNDLIAGGARPLFFLDYIAVDMMDQARCARVVNGIIEGCSLAGCKLIGGETAEMRGLYLKDKLDIAGFCVGEQEWDISLDIDAGCVLYGIPSSGIHANGYTLVRKLLKQTTEPVPPALIESIMKPTRIYSEVLKLLEVAGANVVGVAHITGGGFSDNIGRLFGAKRSQLGIELDHWEFPEVFRWIQRASRLSRAEMLDVFNCGYGMVIITKKKLGPSILYDRRFELTEIGKVV